MTDWREVLAQALPGMTEAELRLALFDSVIRRNDRGVGTEVRAEAAAMIADHLLGRLPLARAVDEAMSPFCVVGVESPGEA